MDGNVHTLPCQPDAAIMREHLDALFAATKDGDGLIELSWTSGQHPHGLTGGRLFFPDQMDKLVAEAVKLNSSPNRNVYISAGLRKLSAALDRRAADVDVERIAALKVDCDYPGTLEEAQRAAAAMGIEPSLVVFTGKEPAPRGSLWWVLQGPSAELARIRAAEEALARKFHTDPTVVNASRVMRLAGGVAWPMKEGRVLEMTGIDDAADTRRRPYSLEEIEGALRQAGALDRPQTAQVLDFNPARPSLDLESLARAARTPGQWHGSTLRAVAHVIARGLPPDLAEDALSIAFTLPGYTTEQTRRDLKPMIEGAVRKWAPERAQPPAGERFLSIGQMLQRPPPQWLVDGFLPENGIGVLWGASGTFKSFIAVDIGLSVAYGLPWRGQKIPTAKPVLYVAGEGAYGLGVRSLVWTSQRAAGQPEPPFYVLPVSVDLTSAKVVDALVADIKSFGVNFGLVVVDTLARNFGGGNENDAVDVNKFVQGIDALRNALDGHILVIHHSGKEDQKGERGSSALRGAVDVSLRVSRESGSPLVRVACVKQKDAAEPEPFTLKLVPAEAVHPVHGEIVSSLIPVFEEPAISAKAGGKMGRLEREILAALDDGPATSRTLAKRLGADPGNVQRSIRSLASKNLVCTADGVHELAVVTSESEAEQ